ncbi:MAG: hypothetical protein GYB65_06320 [Chloroflexi bacterium]|nr:hypothetical protein [Chloroflexota bacterium]
MSMREPDWEALADLQFLLYNRIADSLNAALSAIALSDMPDAGDKPPGYWKERASNKIANVLNLFTAWSYLIRYKMGETIPDRAVRPFPANSLLEWVGKQLQLSPPPRIDTDPLLHANQETLQEALILLYSAAFTQGSGVRLEVEASEQGLWFRIRFNRLKTMPATFDELVESFGDHWRAQDTVFELKTARDFVRLNGSELMLAATQHMGEFGFFVRRAGTVKRKTGLLSPEALKSLSPPKPAPPAAQAPPAPAVSSSAPTESPGSAPAATSVSADDNATPVMPDEQGDQPVPAPSVAELRPKPTNTAPQPDTAPAEPSPPGDKVTLQSDDPTRKIVSRSPETGFSAPTPVVRKPRKPYSPSAPANNKSRPVVTPGQRSTPASDKPAPEQTPRKPATPQQQTPPVQGTPAGRSIETPVVPLTPRYSTAGQPPAKPTATEDSTTPDQAAEEWSAEQETPAQLERKPDPKTDTLIIPVKLPEPAPPHTPRKPPAATSNVALTRETQSFRPVTPDAAASGDSAVSADPAIAADETQDDTSVPPQDGPTPDTPEGAS